MLVINASNKSKDIAFIKEHLFGDVALKDISEEISLLALQGPNAEAILKKLTTEENIPAKYYSFTENASVGGCNCLISRTGYTGEDGFEFYIQNELATPLWNALMDAGKAFDLAPCGLGARDTLRLEASMPLYGHEMTDEISPLETGLGFFVKLDKEENFIGKDALAKNPTPSVTRVGIELLDKGIAREGADVYINDAKIGFVTSGTMCPHLGKAVCMAIIEKTHAEPGTNVVLNVRGRTLNAVIVPMPFYKRAK